jgi:preprotein translocase subunit SecG
MEELVHTPLTIIHALACVFLILIVLLQPGKSGGLGLISSPAATQVFGGRGAGNLLTKITWVTATVFFFTSVTLAYLSTSVDDSLQERAQQVEQVEPETPAAPAEPAAPEPSGDAPAAPPEPAAPAPPAAPEPAGDAPAAPPTKPAPAEPAGDAPAAPPAKPAPAEPTEPAAPAAPAGSD